MNATPDAGWKRWIVDFHDWPLQRAESYPACLHIVEEKVKPQRLESNRERYRRFWWQFGERQQGLYERAKAFENVIAIAYTSNTLAFSFAQAQGTVFYNSTVICSDSFSLFAVLQSSYHVEWIREYGSTLKGDARYTPERCFEPYPFCLQSEVLEGIGKRYYSARSRMMLARQEGLTKTYNRFHSPYESTSDIQKLRDLQVEMDIAVAAAYGWSDLDLGDGFHETKQGIRFTISESARREVLARLLKLNHERYAEEVKQGLHDKKGKAKPASTGRGRKSKASTSTPSLKFGDDEDDPDPPDDTDEKPTPTRKGTSPKATRADRQVQPTPTPEPPARPTPIDEIDTDDIMAAFRQAARGKGWLDRDELLKEVSLDLGYQRLGPKIDEALRGHLRAAIRRRIIETDGPNARPCRGRQHGRLRARRTRRGVPLRHAEGHDLRP